MTTKALLDSGARPDYILYQFIIQNGYQFKNSTILPPVELANSLKVKIYREQSLPVSATDRELTKKTFQIPFLITNITRYDMVLGRN